MAGPLEDRLTRNGWKVHFLDDGYGEPGFWAYKGDHGNPELETGLNETAEEAAAEALHRFPDEFPLA